jgi:hypothetical protein
VPHRVGDAVRGGVGISRGDRQVCAVTAVD